MNPEYTVCDEMTDDELHEAIAEGTRRASWSDNSQAYEIGAWIWQNHTEQDDEDEFDFAKCGEYALAGFERTR